MPGAEAMTESDWQEILEKPTEFDPDELREFLAADMMDVKLRYGRGPTGSR